MQIKFKAITTDGKWVESDGQTIITFNDRCFFLRWSFGPDVWDLRESDYIELIPETVCQFTGLHDKNGKEIFKHDCLRNPKGEEGVVVWSNKRARFELKSENKKGEEIYIDLSQGFCNNKEITGSIHDHLVKQ